MGQGGEKAGWAGKERRGGREVLVVFFKKTFTLFFKFFKLNSFQTFQDF
jgi:hypothetical protein